MPHTRLREECPTRPAARLTYHHGNSHRPPRRAECSSTRGLQTNCEITLALAWHGSFTPAERAGSGHLYNILLQCWQLVCFRQYAAKRLPYTVLQLFRSNPSAARAVSLHAFRCNASALEHGLFAARHALNTRMLFAAARTIPTRCKPTFATPAHRRCNAHTLHAAHNSLQCINTHADTLPLQCNIARCGNASCNIHIGSN